MEVDLPYFGFDLFSKLLAAKAGSVMLNKRESVELVDPESQILDRKQRQLCEDLARNITI